MQLHYCKLQNGVLVRTHSGKMIATNNTLEPIKLPKWANSENIFIANSYAELDTLDCPPAIHTGRSNILVVDFDNELFDTAIAINNSLKQEEQCTNISKSIDKVGGHFIYKFTNNDLVSYIDNPNGRKFGGLDILYGNSLCFIACKQNQTKEIITKSENLIEMPLAIQHLIISYYATRIKDIKSGKEIKFYNGSKLGLLAMRIEDTPEVLQQFLNIVTQPRHKALMAESDKDIDGLHPDKIPDGEGYNFLQSISGVLMLDPSISKDLHKEVLFYLNSLFSEPLKGKRVIDLWESDVNKPMFNYDPDWNTKTFSRVNRNNEMIEYYAYLEDGSYVFYKINTTTTEILKLKNKVAALDDVTLEAASKIKAEDFLGATKILKEILYTPMVPYGLQGDYLNIYKQNTEQRVFYNPSLYKDEWSLEEQQLAYDDKHPRYPKVTLGALRNAIGEYNFERFLSFMRRKFMTRDHSPIFFVFYGVPHSFKTGVVNGVFSKLAAGRYLSVNSKVLLDKYTGWLKDQDLIMLDEVHHLNRSQLEEVIGFLNTVTGTPILSGLRSMYKEATNSVSNNTITFVICTNQLVSLTSEVQDRRMVLFKADTKVSTALNMTDENIMQSIKDETINFAYYLSTQISDLDDQAYKRNDSWKHIEYEEYKQDALRLEDKLISAIDKNDIKTFINICVELGISPVEFNKCVEVLTGNRVNIRLANSSPTNSVGGKPGLFDFTDTYNGFNKITFLRHVGNLSNVSRYVNDVNPLGVTANRKCIWKLGTIENIQLAKDDFVRGVMSDLIKIK